MSFSPPWIADTDLVSSTRWFTAAPFGAGRAQGRGIRLAIIWLLLAAVAAARNLPPEMTPAGAVPDTLPQALRLVLEDPWSPREQPLRLPILSEPQSVELHFPGRPVPPDKLVVLRLRTRLVSPNFGGWNNYLGILVDGVQLDSYRADGMPRLLNRRESFVRTADPRWPREGYFKPAVGVPALLVPFGPDWESLDPRLVSDRREGYWYVLDISDLAATPGEHVLAFTNLARVEFWGGAVDSLQVGPLLVDAVQIGTVDAGVRAAMTQDLDAEFGAFVPVVELRWDDRRVEASAGGALRLSWRGDAYLLESSFSEPGPRMRRHFLRARPDTSWTVRATRTDSGLCVVARARSFTATRQVYPDGRFLRVRDEIRNTAEVDVGIAIRHDLLSSPASTWRLAGLEKVPTADHPCYNPTVFIGRSRSGLGAAVKNGVFRAEMSVTASRGRRFSMANEHFGLGQGTAYVIPWSLYAGGPDFWAFINALRNDWGVNHTIPGMFGFFYPTDPQVTPAGVIEDPQRLRTFLDRVHLDVFAVEPWFEYYYKPRWWRPREVFRTHVRKLSAALKAIDPQARVLACLESFLYYVPESFFQGTLPSFWVSSHGTVPRDRENHAYVLDERGTAVLDSSPWRDSVFRDVDGRAVIDLYYAHRYHDGGANLKVYPLPGNYWQNRFLDMLEYCLGPCGLDGVYIDSFSYYNQRTYGIWDGHSVDLDPRTGAIRSRYANLSLLTAAARRRWVQFCLDRGKLVYVNGKPMTPELQALPQISFMEAEWSFHLDEKNSVAPRAAQAMLSSPLALGIRPSMHVKDKSRYAEVLQRAVIAYLRYGALYCFYAADILPPSRDGECGVLNHMFPFTPIALHEGWVLGRERIITAVSGTFPWAHAQRPIYRRFDITGRPLAGGCTMHRTGAAWTVTVELDDWNATAVVEAPPAADATGTAPQAPALRRPGDGP